MKKTITALTIASVLMVNSVTVQAAEKENTAQDQDIISQINDMPEEEKWGVSIGAILGGIFGGPPGAIIVGIAGDFVGKHFVAEKEISALEQQIAQQQTHLENDERSFKHKIKNLEIQHQKELVNIAASYENSERAELENLLISLMFRTGSSTLEPHYKQQITAIAKVLNRSSELTIDLSGYTDKQGDEELNKKLAEQRVESVKQHLLTAGVEEHRIVTNAVGELVAEDDTEESEVNYFARKVVMKLTKPTEEVAQQTTY